MRYVPMMIFAIVPALGLIAPSAVSNAAPRTIDDCEKIQEADAYNLCLASFGPVARGHGVATKVQEAAAAIDVEEKGRSAARPPRHRYAQAHHGRSRHHVSRHASVKHGHGRHAKATAHSRGKRVAFTVVSGQPGLR